MKLEIKSLRGGYGSKIVLDGVELTVEKGSVVTLLGANGSGKSTLLKMIGRALRPCSGEILFDGKSIASMSSAELAKELAVLPQTHQSPGELTVEELVSFGRYPHRRFGLVPSAQDREAVENAIKKTRISELRKRSVSELSGGERQRAWIAMTLAQDPKLLLLDEPTTFLDIRSQFEILELVRRLNRESGITVVMVLHDLNLAVACSDTLVMMKDRKIRCSGPPENVMKIEILRDVFGIESKIEKTSSGLPFCMVTGTK